jgi:hypothetical protein
LKDTQEFQNAPKVIKKSHELLLNRFLKEFDNACKEKGYTDFQRLQIGDAVRLIQDVGYLSDPRRTNKDAKEIISVIEE